MQTAATCRRRASRVSLDLKQMHLVGALFNLQAHTSAAVRHVQYLGAGGDIGWEPAHQQLVSYDEQQGLPPYGSELHCQMLQS